MKMIVQRTRISTNPPFVLAEIKEYTRLEHDETDATVTKTAWEAVAEVESFAQIALLRQTIRLTIFDGVLGDGLSLPVGPMQDGAPLTVTLDGTATTAFDAVPGNRPYLSWDTALRGGAHRRVVIEYEAGFGDNASDVPEDLGQAIIDQAYMIYDGRSIDEVLSRRRSMQLARVAARYRGVSL